MEHEEIKRLRIKKELTQIQIARLCGVSLAGYRLWETGAGKPTEKNLEKLKKALLIK